MKIAALAGGVGGAKLAQGLSQILKEEEFSVIVNSGDDFYHYGLYICPDFDTVCYTLAGFANRTTGWGIQDDTFITLKALQDYGFQDWFKLGDKDLATHLERTRLLREGKTLTEIALYLERIWKLKHTVLPMTNIQVPTFIDTIELGLIPFQEYFVKYHFQPRVKRIVFKNQENSIATSQVLKALTESQVVVLCPSNPFVSIDPILSLPGVKGILENKFVLAVSPLIAGKAVKGPLDKMCDELGIDPNPVSIAEHYSKIIKAIFVDQQDERYALDLHQSGIIVQVTDIFMPNTSHRIRLAEEILKFLEISR